MVLQPLLSARLATLSLAVSTLLFALTANAAVIGDTAIYSKLNEPLSASIEVSDIDSDSFTVSVANKLLYQQMGMSTSVPVTVAFEKTSDSTGVLILSSPKPVSEPFADVVLIVNDKGQVQSLPKTLLLPLAKTSKLDDTDTRQTIVGTSPKPKLPTVTSIEEPAKLVVVPKEPLLQTTPDTSLMSRNAKSETEAIIDSETNMLVQSDVDEQADTLSTQITRKYRRLEDDAQSVDVDTPSEKYDQQTAAVYPDSTDTDMTVAQNNTGEVTKTTNGVTDTDTTSDAPDVSAAATLNHSETQTASSSANLPLGKVTYKVQRNDNLWTISQQIADKNGMTVFEVMEQIQAYNPKAFINGQKSQLLANVELALPDYEVIPSKLGMRAALKARDQTRASSNAAQQSKTVPQTNKHNTKEIASRPKSGVNKPLLKPRLTLVTPTKQGQSTGTATTGSKQRANLNGSLVASLDTARKTTAAQAQLVRGLNNDLSARARKLQLYNQKLAELEKRLKELRDQ